MLELKSVDAGYGTFQALFGVGLEVRAGEAVGVIGPNGAGKTTMFNCLTGFYRPPVGRMRLSVDDGSHFLLERQVRWPSCGMCASMSLDEGVTRSEAAA